MKASLIALSAMVCLSAFASGSSAQGAITRKHVRMGVTKQQPTPKPPFAVSGTFSGIRQAKQVVIRDQKAFEELWKQHQPNGANPASQIDFKKNDVIAAFAGSKTTGGYSVEIGEIERKGKSAVVHITVWKPAPGAMLIQAFTYPFAMTAVPKLPQDVKFVVKEAVKSDK